MSEGIKRLKDVYARIRNSLPVHAMAALDEAIDGVEGKRFQSLKPSRRTAAAAGKEEKPPTSVADQPLAPETGPGQPQPVKAKSRTSSKSRTASSKSSAAKKGR